MITEAHMQEALSRAYVHAVAARAGIVAKIEDRSHDYGIDGDFYQVSILKGHRKETGIALHFQLKSTTCATKKSHLIRYEMDTPTYNMLAHRMHKPHVVPAIFLLFCLPGNWEDQFTMGEDELIIRNCCYWHAVTNTEAQNIQLVIQDVEFWQGRSPYFSSGANRHYSSNKR